MFSHKRLSLRLTRDSVAAGDDAFAPHVRWLRVPIKGKSETLARKIQDMRYLAVIGSGNATWVLLIDEKPHAVIAQQWSASVVIRREYRVSADSLIHVAYYQQQDPDIVVQKLKRRGLT